MSSSIDVVYEDEWLKIVSKPSNLIVHHSRYARNLDERSLCQLINETSIEATLHPIHRLDRKTSGLIIFAKLKHIIPKFQKLFDTNAIEKSYLALVRGHIHDNGKLEYPIRADEETTYKDAETHYKPLQLIDVDIPVVPYPSSRYTILELTPKTGRMHQLRKHMNKFSHPIIGDPKYGNRHHNHMFIEELDIGNLFLHAYKLRFNHPETDELITISAELPDFWNKALNRFKVNFEVS
ncbi:MAG: pseudouridine synthase [Crocinitomicaceae bacterium]